ncbi:MAG: methionyl-tRNA formyltransferase [Bacteroidales bacterium]|nr:methionyl-tRNA formyltransferase [Bacteroidales bacterium]
MKIVFFGTPDFAVQSLDAIMLTPRHEVCAVVTVPDRQAGRGHKFMPSAVKEYALAHNLPLLQPERLRDPQFLEQLAAFQADMFVVVAFRMLPEAVWNMPPHGTFNLHASLLPAYRGAAPINHAIINGDTRTGVTTFLLNHYIDEGQILLQAETPIAPDDNAGSLHDRLALMGRDLVVRTLDGIQAGTVTPRPQEGTPSAAPKIFKDFCLLDLHQPAHHLANLVRGLAPYPAALLTLVNPQGQEVLFKVFDVAPIPDPNGTPGALVCDEKKVLKIGVADGFIQILSLQMSGKRKNSIEDFLRGNKLKDWKTKL